VSSSLSGPSGARPARCPQLTEHRDHGVQLGSAGLGLFAYRRWRKTAA
jgi:hypothetical protein